LDRSGPKWIKLNHKNLARTSDLLGKISVVILLPKDLQIIIGGPQKRREFLDEVLCNQSPRYLSALLDYQRMLKQKNSYLRDCKIHKRAADMILIESLNGALLEPAVQIFLKRQAFIQKLQIEMQRMYREIFPVAHEVEIKHICDVGANCDEVQYRTGLINLLQRSMSFEIKKGHALVGPAHDDVKIMLDGRNSRHFASNGQKRLLSLALRMVQGELLQNGQAPIYLVDDVLLELDAAHRSSVLQCLRRAQQVFFTTTSTHWLDEDVILKGRVLRVESGHVVADGVGGGVNAEPGGI
jgi:DNA replication and repair protein RecF